MKANELHTINDDNGLPNLSENVNFCGGEPKASSEEDEGGIDVVVEFVE